MVDRPRDTQPTIGQGSFALDRNKDMTGRSVLDMKPFVPAKNYEVSQRFYADLGFKSNWANEQVAELQIGEHRFLLQNYYVEAYASNFMMSLMVESADSWWEHIQTLDLVAKYQLYMAKPPQLQPWGLHVLFLSDPTGVLWHIAERPKR